MATFFEQNWTAFESMTLREGSVAPPPTEAAEEAEAAEAAMAAAMWSALREPPAAVEATARAAGASRCLIMAPNSLSEYGGKWRAVAAEARAEAAVD